MGLATGARDGIAVGSLIAVDVAVGGDAPISVQSMTTTLTADVNATLQQIAELTAAGCQVVRVAVPSQDDADALDALGEDGACWDEWFARFFAWPGASILRLAPRRTQQRAR